MIIINKKGFTVFELLIGFVFLSMISYFLMSTIFNVREQQQFAIIKGELTNLQINLTNDINADLTNNIIEVISRCPNQQYCIMINYSNIGPKKLEANVDDNIIIYGDNKYYLVEESYITNLFIGKEFYLATNIGRKNSILKIIISIEHIDIPGDYGININYLYNNNEEYINYVASEVTAWYKLDGDANDYSGNNSHGIVYGATSTTNRFRMNNRAMSFNGTSDYVEIANNPSLSLTGDLTIAIWLKLELFPSSWTGIINKINTDHNNEFNLRLKGPHEDEGQFYFGKGDRAIILSFTPTDCIELNSWVHIVAVRKNGEYMKLYCNGKMKAERTIISTEIPTSTTKPILLMNQNDKYYNKGVIDDIQIYNRALSKEEIEFIYH